MYSAIASAAAKCRPIFRRLPLFSLSRIVTSSPSRWKCQTSNYLVVGNANLQTKTL